MLHAIKHCHNTSLCNSTRILPPFLPFDELNLCNDYIFMNSEDNDRLCFLNKVDLDTNLLDNMILHQVVIQPTTKPRSVGPHKLKSKTTKYKKKSYIKTRNSGVQVPKYIKDLLNQIQIGHAYYIEIYFTQTKI